MTNKMKQCCGFENQMVMVILIVMDKTKMMMLKKLMMMKMIKEKLYLVCFFGSFDPQGTCKTEHCIGKNTSATQKS